MDTLTLTTMSHTTLFPSPSTYPSQNTIKIILTDYSETTLPDTTDTNTHTITFELESDIWDFIQAHVDENNMLLLDTVVHKDVFHYLRDTIQLYTEFTTNRYNSHLPHYKNIYLFYQDNPSLLIEQIYKILYGFAGIVQMTFSIKNTFLQWVSSQVLHVLTNIPVLDTLVHDLEIKKTLLIDIHTLFTKDTYMRRIIGFYASITEMEKLIENFTTLFHCEEFQCFHRMQTNQGNRTEQMRFITTKEYPYITSKYEFKFETREIPPTLSTINTELNERSFFLHKREDIDPQTLMNTRENIPRLGDIIQLPYSSTFLLYYTNGDIYLYDNIDNTMKDALVLPKLKMCIDIIKKLEQYIDYIDYIDTTTTYTEHAQKKLKKIIDKIQRRKYDNALNHILWSVIAIDAYTICGVIIGNIIFQYNISTETITNIYYNRPTSYLNNVVEVEVGVADEDEDEDEEANEQAYEEDEDFEYYLEYSQESIIEHSYIRNISFVGKDGVRPMLCVLNDTIRFLDITTFTMNPFRRAYTIPRNIDPDDLTYYKFIELPDICRGIALRGNMIEVFYMPFTTRRDDMTTKEETDIQYLYSIDNYLYEEGIYDIYCIKKNNNKHVLECVFTNNYIRTIWIEKYEKDELYTTVISIQLSIPHIKQMLNRKHHENDLFHRELAMKRSNVLENIDVGGYVRDAGADGYSDGDDDGLLYDTTDITDTTDTTYQLYTLNNRINAYTGTINKLCTQNTMLTKLSGCSNVALWDVYTRHTIAKFESKHSILDILDDNIACCKTICVLQNGSIVSKWTDDLYRIH